MEIHTKQAFCTINVNILAKLDSLLLTPHPRPEIEGMTVLPTNSGEGESNALQQS